MSVVSRPTCGRAATWLSIFAAIDGLFFSPTLMVVPRSGVTAVATGVSGGGGRGVELELGSGVAVTGASVQAVMARVAASASIPNAASR